MNLKRTRPITQKCLWHQARHSTGPNGRISFPSPIGCYLSRTMSPEYEICDKNRSPIPTNPIIFGQVTQSETFFRVALTALCHLISAVPFPHLETRSRLLTLSIAFNLITGILSWADDLSSSRHHWRFQPSASSDDAALSAGSTPLSQTYLALQRKRIQ